jgi:hypothetical protein
VGWRRGKGGPAERQIQGLDRATTLGDLAKRHIEALVNRCAVGWRRGKGGPAERQIQGPDRATTLGDLAQRHIEALINRQPVCRGRIATVLAVRLIATLECGRGEARIVDRYICDCSHLPGGEPGHNQ